MHWWFLAALQEHNKMKVHKTYQTCVVYDQHVHWSDWTCLKKYYRSYSCQSLSISVWYLGTSAYVPRGPRPLPQRFEVPTPHSEIRVSQYQVPMILRDMYIIYICIIHMYIHVCTSSHRRILMICIKTSTISGLKSIPQYGYLPVICIKKAMRHT